MIKLGAKTAIVIVESAESAFDVEAAFDARKRVRALTKKCRESLLLGHELNPRDASYGFVERNRNFPEQQPLASDAVGEPRRLVDQDLAGESPERSAPRIKGWQAFE